MRNKSLYLTDLQKWLLKEQYIIDGNHNYGDSLEIRIKDADTIIFLNYNHFICLAGAIKRYIKFKNRSRPSMTKGCCEEIDIEFIKYVLWDYPRIKKKLIFQLINNEFQGQFYEVRNRKALKKLLNELGVMV